MRALQPDRLVVTDSGLWAVDAVQPVAAVLAPDTGDVTALVSWSQLPPAPVEADRWSRRVVPDGAHLWVQHHAGGPLARVSTAGVEAVAWTGGLHLQVCSPGAAWCLTPPPPPHWDLGAPPDTAGHARWSRLLRVDAAGGCTSVLVEARVRSVRLADEGLLLEALVQPERSRRDEAVDDRSPAGRPTRWLLLPLGAPLPESVGVASHALPEDTDLPARAPAGVGRYSSWHGPSQHPGAYRGGRPVVAGDLDWHVGWAPDPVADASGLWRTVVATGHDADGVQAQRHDLGRGSVLAAAGAAGLLVVAVDRGPWRPRRGRGPVDVVAVDPTRRRVEVLLPGGSVDVTAGCWPLGPEPVDAGSYAQQFLAANDSINAYWRGPSGVRPLADGLSRAESELVDAWPDTALQWTFDSTARPGLRMRRRVALFDELGRPTDPQYAAVQLMEDLDTDHLPPASAARDGILDI